MQRLYQCEIIPADGPADSLRIVSLRIVSLRIVMARLVRATYRGTVLVDMAWTSRAMTLKTINDFTAARIEVRP
jgi:hypothetical protein